MALPQITTADFTGSLKISGNQFRESKLQEYIDEYYKYYVREILGDAAYVDATINDKKKWDDLFIGRDYVDERLRVRLTNGLREQIIKLIYFEFVRDDWSSSQVGKQHMANENSERLSDSELKGIVTVRYNSAARAIRNEIYDFLHNFRFVEEDITTITDNLDGTYTVVLPNTEYLDDGDTVEIDGVEYTVSNVTATSFDVMSTESVVGDVAVWEPYKDVIFRELDFITVC